MLDRDPPEREAGPRPDDLSMMEATAGARQPVRFLWLNPVVGAVGSGSGRGGCASSSPRASECAASIRRESNCCWQ